LVEREMIGVLMFEEKLHKDLIGFKTYKVCPK